MRIVLAVFLMMAAPPAGAWAESQAPADLVVLLRGGGHTIYFRHAATDWSQSDNIREFGDWRSCDGGLVRQLSEAGRRTAKEIGVAMRALAIPVSKILSSEYCRAVETARLLDLGPVETTLDIMNLRAADYVGGRSTAVDRFRAILATDPAPDTNRVISAHGNLSREATGAYPGEAGVVIIVADPKAAFGFRVIGMLAPDDWAKLAGQED